MVAKILSALSQAGLVSGSPGPGGGYALARSPHLMRLREPYDLFEREDTSNNCPFGGGVCGVGEPCAMHDRLRAMQGAIRKLLEETTFDIFRVAVQEQGLQPVPKGTKPEVARETYRAPHARRKQA